MNLVLGQAQVSLDGQNARIYAGRDPQSCQLADANPTLSRRHAELWWQDGAAYIRDLGSANGTWVDGKSLGQEPIAIQPGQQVWLGHVPLGVTWPITGKATVMATEIPAELKALIAQRQQAVEAGTAAPPPPLSFQAPPAPGTSASLSAGGASTPMPSEFSYRKQGSNDNGVLLLALRQETHWCGANIDGYVEFTALDSENVASIVVELVEMHRKGSKSGHVWDRVLVRQGPWKAKNGDVLPLPFALRVPPGTSGSSRDVQWEIRGQVDINWAVDIDAMIPITMRNPDIDRLRDALGAMDYRVEDLDSQPGGQRFEGMFRPPAHMAKEWGVNSIKLEIEYLGANLKVRMKLDRKGLHHDPAIDQVFELGRLRNASQAEVNATLEQMLGKLLPKQ
ncbi:MAG: FHA domain-containing protein [Kofleriaceae bacterium]